MNERSSGHHLAAPFFYFLTQSSRVSSELPLFDS